MMIVTISEKGGQQSQYDFQKPEITIGRMKGNDIVLPKGNVSKKHSRISVVDGNVIISDLNSTNGTYVNGRKVTGEQPLTENDKIYIGDFILQVEAPQPANQAPAGPPQPPSGPNQSGYGGGGAQGGQGGQGGMPPSPPSAPDQQVSGLGGGGPVDDLFAAGDSQAPGVTGNDPAAQRRNSSAGAPMHGSGPHGGQPNAGQPGASQPSAGQPSAGQPSASQPSASQPSASQPGSSQPGSSQQGAAAEPALDFDDLGFGSEPSSGPNRRASSAGASPSPRHNSGAGNPAPSGRNRSPSGAGAPSQPSQAPSQAPSQSQPHRPERTPPGPSREPMDNQDRLGGGGVGRSARPRGGVGPAQEVRSEFDADFHAAQHDVARVLFETVNFEELPLDYPPTPAERDDFERRVNDAVGKVNPMGDRDALVDLITSECVGLGPIELYLDDPDVQDIYVNRFDQILVRRNGEMIVAQRAFSHPDFLTTAAQRLLGTRDEMIGADEVRFSDGTRVHVVMPPLSVDGPALTIRKPPTEHPTLQDLQTRGVLSPGMREFLERAVEAGRSFLVAGPTSSGKSTLLGAIAKLIPSGTRVVTVEESTHLDLPQASVVRLEANPTTGYDMKYLVRTAVAMHPQRILVDECRGGEAYEWVTSAASGTEGSMITAHGTSPSDALGRLESLCLLGNPEISPRGLREQIARAVDFVVVVHRSDDNGFRVRQVTEVQGVDLDAFRLNDVFYHRVEGSEEQFHPTGYIPLFYEDLRHAGVEVDFDIFRD